MKLSIFGLGYVGTVTACCLAKWGHDVIGVDISQLKVESINKCESPIMEPGISELLQEVVENNKFIATVDASEAIMKSDLSLICVGTPSNHNGSLNLTYVYNVAEQIGRALSKKSQYHIVIVRSTVLPGTAEKVASIIEELSGRILGKGFSIASNPEFLREGSSIQDFEQPPYTVVGTSDDRVIAALRELYGPTNAPIYCLNIGEAELVKYFSNMFHALKIVFANEAGSICKKYGIDSHNVIDVFLKDTKLNVSSAYLKPGFAFGGSCLPKDIRSILYQSKTFDLRLPLVESLLTSNEIHIQAVIDWVIKKKKKEIGILGLSFKSNTDDMRESPVVKVVETLLGKGYSISIYDPNINLTRLIGANKQYIEQVIPHISRLLKLNIHEVLDRAEAIIIANKNEEYMEAVLKPRADQIILDLVRITDNCQLMGRNYEGICW
jgi:GDP-mannose 6-dehydrogenase